MLNLQQATVTRPKPSTTQSITTSPFFDTLVEALVYSYMQQYKSNMHRPLGRKPIRHTMDFTNLEWKPRSYADARAATKQVKKTILTRLQHANIRANSLKVIFSTRDLLRGRFVLRVVLIPHF